MALEMKTECEKCGRKLYLLVKLIFALLNVPFAPIVQSRCSMFVQIAAVNWFPGQNAKRHKLCRRAFSSAATKIAALH